MLLWTIYKGVKMINIKIKKINSMATIPTQAHEGDAYDLRACVDTPITIWKGETKKIPTGIALEIPCEYFGAIFARSGLATKKGLNLANGVGLCDPNYRGEYIVALHNGGNETITIKNGDRIAQLQIIPRVQAYFEEVSNLKDADRGEDGFGSTGIE